MTNDLNLQYSESYKKLNAEQKIAVDTINGPVLVLAGPGTGKTQVLSMRIANILIQTDTSPDAILALTFTESGVRAMKERLVSIAGKAAYYVNIHTFHSFASDIIRENPDEFITSSQIEPLSDLERIYIFKEIFDELDLKIIKPFNAPYFYLQTAIDKIKDLKRESIDPDEYEKIIKDSELEEKDLDKNNELLKIYRIYLEKLKKYKRYDFEDMINFVIEKFKSSPDFLKRYQEKFQYFLVDEFQDTNSAQAELLYLLNSYGEWADNPNLFVVGDDDQSVYRFQGASIENIINFYDKFPKTQIIVLKTNYRSNQHIIDTAQSVIKNNKLRISEQIKIEKVQKSFDQNNSDQKIKTHHAKFSTYFLENYYIANQIHELLNNRVKPSEIAIIYRNNADAEEIKKVLTKFNIKYKIVGGENILKSGVIIRFLHLLKVIDKMSRADEDLELFTLLNYEFLHFDQLDVLKLSRFASSKKINLFEAILHADFSSINLPSEKKLKDFIEKIENWQKESANLTFIEFIEKVLNKSGFLDWVISQPENYLLISKINSFISEVKRLNSTEKNLTLSKFLHYIDLMYENKISINEESYDLQYEAVNLLTAHRSKGLEFEYVFVPQFIDKKWSNSVMRDLLKLPNNILETNSLLTPEQKKNHQEEDDRRLFFVVLTRAKKALYITSAKTYQSAKETLDSMFLQEISPELVSEVSAAEYEENSQEIMKDMLKNDYQEKILTHEERAFLKDALKDFKLSASSLNTYLDCPYKFKLQFLFKTPKAQTKALILGIAVHKTLEECYKLLKDNQVPTFEFMNGEFIKALNKEIINDKEKNEILAEGEMVLKVYYETYRDEFEQSKGKFYFLEKFFGYGWSKPMLNNIHLQGKIDKIEVLDPKEKTIKITDYKTGNPKSRNEIMGQTAFAKGDEYRQIMFYKLIIDLDAAFQYKVSEIALDFIGNRKSKPKREVFTFDSNEIDLFKKVVIEAHSNMMNLNFNRTKDYSTCENCDFKHHCWPDGIPSKMSNEQLSLI